jgi:K+-sensing histidine kinase KdpD
MAIGPALITRMIEVHGGKIRIESEHKGRGAMSVFTVAEVPQKSPS